MINAPASLTQGHSALPCSVEAAGGTTKKKTHQKTKTSTRDQPLPVLSLLPQPKYLEVFSALISDFV